eukprot:CAMPEP_0195520492 /NCGR_PEP_ID=MMETSP0794_2-20130614/17042_1 /TAXON_ID=515487 /ORGANISM="Stephanopyxis turris, Strain CCMP 815" /LENGTH=388 /DNA_ID=CAMNT_0040649865 /DNA_START=101 /DNA_END=1264 /DNA_ORIENTATION=+
MTTSALKAFALGASLLNVAVAAAHGDALFSPDSQHRRLKKIDYSGLSESEQLDLFESYQQDFGKVYADEAESSKRFEAFKQSLERISLQNKQDTAIYGLTKFSDMTQEEFQHSYLLAHHRGKPVVHDKAAMQAKYASKLGITAAGTFHTSFTDDCDWREPQTCNSSIADVLAPVANQNQCGGCYAYSAVGTLESRFALSGYNLTQLSVSEVLDCDTSEFGCGGGDAMYALNYLRHNGAWSAADYPDTAGPSGTSSPCPAPANQPEATVLFNETWIAVPWASGAAYSQGKYVDVVAKAVREFGPVAACMNSDWGWSDYVGGVISDSTLCTPYWDEVDHCVVIAGYRASEESVQEMGMPYWVVRNSWGSDWGHGGYLYISMDSNVCGVLN